VIAGLEGKLAAIGADHIVINVGGVYYRVAMPGSSIGTLGAVGDTVHVHTYLYVREDQLSLFGATSERQLKLFESLLTVSGIGPKAGLSILSALQPDTLESAIASGDVDALTRVPGIGKKTASRLILELKGKLDLVAAAGIITSPTAATEVVEALSGLGYTGAEIQAALSGLPRDEDLTTEDMIMYALKRLGR
jgi:Holliday junction DNA helicase RuvA